MPEVGIREGEKLHEIMVTREDSLLTYEYDKHFIVYPHFDWWDKDKIQTGGKRWSRDLSIVRVRIQSGFR